MNEKINGIIVNGKVYRLVSDNDADVFECKDCDIREKCEKDFGISQGYCYMTDSHLMDSVFKFSQTLTDKLNGKTN